MTALRLGRIEYPDHQQGPLWLRIDVSIILLSFGLLGIGLLAVYSATRGIGEVPDRSFIEKQLVFVVAGLIGMVAVIAVDYRKARPYVALAYLGAVVLLVGLFFFGSEFNNATSWYSFGFATLQPSEFAKLSLILALAAWFSHTQQTGDGLRFIDVVVGAAMAGFLGFLVLLQPDYGTVMVYGAIIGGIVLIAGVRLWQVIVMFAGLVGGLVVAFASGGIAEYQLNRFTAFADPETALRYNVDQSEIAIGNGGITGQGLFQGTQNNASLVPEKETDFIFSVIGEELGFVGGGLLLALFGFLLIRIWRVAHLAENEFGRLICVGVFSMYLFQGFQSIGMNMGMMPVTGIPLPLISYGGSSMVTSLMALGLVQNVHAHRLR